MRMSAIFPSLHFTLSLARRRSERALRNKTDNSLRMFVPRRSVIQRPLSTTPENMPGNRTTHFFRSSFPVVQLFSLLKSGQTFSCYGYCHSYLGKKLEISRENFHLNWDVKNSTRNGPFQRIHISEYPKEISPVSSLLRTKVLHDVLLRNSRTHERLLRAVLIIVSRFCSRSENKRMTTDLFPATIPILSHGFCTGKWVLPHLHPVLGKPPALFF